MSDKKPKADYNRYITGKDASMLDFPWRENIRHDIENGLFKSFTSGNSTAKQIVIVLLDRNGFKSKITSLGCGVHKIEVDNESE